MLAEVEIGWTYRTKFSRFQLATSDNSEITDLISELPVNVRSYRGDVGTG